MRYIVYGTLGAHLAEKEREIRAKYKLTGRLGGKGYERAQRRADIEFQFVLQSSKALDLGFMRNYCVS